jgi:hypothetical protein
VEWDLKVSDGHCLACEFIEQNKHYFKRALEIICELFYDGFSITAYIYRTRGSVVVKALC